MLCLVVQLGIIPISETELDVVECKSKCKKSKNNIVAKITGHHQSCGSIFGFGSCHEFKINEETHSSVGQYKTHEGFQHFATSLQD